MCSIEYNPTFNNWFVGKISFLYVSLSSFTKSWSAASKWLEAFPRYC
jgi:hypothetical protein